MTFRDNAELKARHVHAAIGGAAWVLADDSGIAASALDGRPGVRSARLAGEHATDAENLNALLMALAGRDDRSVAYVAELVAISPAGRELHARGELRGRMAERPRGSGGFGYDPAFVPDGESRTVGEMEAGGEGRHLAPRACRRRAARAAGRGAAGARAVAATPTTEQALAALNRAHGCGLRVVAAMPDGEASHATVVADFAGNRSLLKWWQIAGGESDSLEHIERVVPLVERLRRRGYPSPRHLLTATAESLLFVLQELLPGRPPVPLLPIHVEQLVDLNRLQEEERGDEWWVGRLPVPDTRRRRRRLLPARSAAAALDGRRGAARPRDRGRGGHRSRCPAGRRHRALRSPSPERAGRGRPHHRHRRLRGRAGRRSLLRPGHAALLQRRGRPRRRSPAPAVAACSAIVAMPPPCAPTSRTCRCG